MIKLNVPYLDDTVIASIADKVRNEKNATSIPVNIEGLIENDFHADIVPIPNLQRDLDIEGSCSPDFSAVYVDDFIYKQREYRYRFTIAHELGHIVLHPDYFEKLKFSSIPEWIKVINEIDQSDYNKMEYQANAFAGQILVPSEFLKTEFPEQLRLYSTQIEEAKENSIGRNAYLQVVLDEIAYSLSPKFKVSTAVLTRRINTESLEQKIP